MKLLKKIAHDGILYCWVSLLFLSAGNCFAQSTQKITHASLSAGEYQIIGTQTPINLPHNWNSDSPQREGVHTYTLTFNLENLNPQNTNEQTKLAAYFVRMGNRFDIYLNGKAVHMIEDLQDNSQGRINQPYLQLLPREYLSLGTNILAVTVGGDRGRYAGLSSVEIGDVEALKKKYALRYFFQQIVPYFIVFAALLLAATGLIAYLFLRNKNVLIFSIGSLAWAVVTSFELITQPPLPYLWQLFLYDALFAVSTACLAINVAVSLKFISRKLINLTYGFVAAAIGMTTLYVAGYAWFRGVFLLLILLFIVGVSGFYVRACLRKKYKFSKIAFAFLLVCVLFGAYDQVMVFRNKNGYESYSMVRYLFIMITLAVAVMYAMRVARMGKLVQRSRIRLNARLNLAREKLKISYEKQILVEKDKSQTTERARIMRDLHDGLGHKIVGLMVDIKSEQVEHAVLSAQVEDLLAELRLTVSAVYKNYDTVAAMLGDLRDTLEKLCLRAQITLHWQVDEIVEKTVRNNADIINLQKIVIESFTNIVKHSAARNVSLRVCNVGNSHIDDSNSYESSIVDGKISLVLEHDGKHYTPQSSHVGNGIRNIAQRAAESGFVLRYTDEGRVFEVLLG